mgnify:FL=1
MSSQTRQAKAELLQAFRLEINRKIKKLRAAKTDSKIVRQAILNEIEVWREARNLLSELAGKE